MSLSESYVRVNFEKLKATLTFYSPQKNSLSSQMLQEMQKTIRTLENHPEVKILLLQSEGEGTFCAGAALHEVIQLQEFSQAVTFFEGFAHLINACRSSSKIIVAKVQGKCVGGGVGLAAMADYTLASQEASLRLSELSLGLGPFVIAPAVIRKIGSNAFWQMSLDTQWRSAQWAFEKGLFAQILKPEELHPHCENFVQKLAAYPQETLTLIKKEMWEGTENWNELLKKQAEKTARLSLSSFTQNLLQSYKK